MLYVVIFEIIILLIWVLFFQKKYFTKNNLISGTVIVVSLILSFIIYYIKGEISYFKLLSFTSIFLITYFIGLFFDILKNKVLCKFLSNDIINIIFIFVFSVWINYFFNEDFWLIKGIFTSLLVYRFQIANFKPKRVLNLYFLIWILISFFNLRWTQEVYYISFIVISTYYLFEAFGYTFLGKGGINLIGFILGLIVCEVCAFNILFLVFLIFIIYSSIFLDDLRLNVNSLEKIKHQLINGNKIANFIKSIIFELKLR